MAIPGKYTEGTVQTSRLKSNEASPPEDRYRSYVTEEQGSKVEFNEQAGRLVVVMGGPASGKTAVVADMTSRYARTLPTGSQVAYWDMQRNHDQWRRLIESRAGGDLSSMDYRNEVDLKDWRRTLHEKCGLQHHLLVIDGLNLFVPEADLHEALRFLKILAVRRSLLVLTTLHLPCWSVYEFGRHASLENVPEWVTLFTDAIYVCLKPLAPDQAFYVMECRGTARRCRGATVCEWDMQTFSYGKMVTEMTEC